MSEDTSGYTIKDMLKIQQNQLDRIESKVDTIGEQKADKILVERLAQRFDMMERDGSQKAGRALELASANSRRLDVLDTNMSQPDNTVQGRRAMELIARADKDHEFLNGIRTIAGLVKFLGVGGILAIVVALVSYYLTGHPLP